MTSHPLAAMPSQSAKPVLHVPMVQAPVLHAAVALARVQAAWHEPQFDAFVARFTSHPSDAMPLQSAKPMLQV